ncbi:MAG: aminotransferase class V-fold PLP-dependent enzyme [Candidatus Brocadiia bacterium]
MPLEDEILDLCQSCRHDAERVSLANVRSHVAGLDRRVPLTDGRSVPYTNLDNAATTPPFTTVLSCLERFAQCYSSVHRGSGFKSLFSTHVYELCRKTVAEFIGADLDHHTLIFVQNATHALNKLARRICPAGGHVVISTTMEHHSNMLPWRRLGCTVEYSGVRPSDGSLDMAELERRVRAAAGRLCLVTVTGASNVTGIMPPLRRIARLAHEHGALVAADVTQLVPRRPLRMGAPDDPERLDFIAFSAHKMYAPFGSGVLVGPRRVFEQGEPDMVGGGTIHAVTTEHVHWAEPPERDEAGTPNVTGVVALASAVQTLRSIGMEEVAEHERALTRRLLSRLRPLEGLRLYGPDSLEAESDRISVVPFQLENLTHGRVAAALGFEWGIGVRNGCFCAQPYLRELLGIPPRDMGRVVDALVEGRHAAAPGLVRASCAVYNTPEEVDYLAEALERLIADGPRQRYVLHPEYGDYVPEGVPFQLEDYVRL